MRSQYKKLNPIDHCLLRPDTYIGTIQTQLKSIYLYDEESNQIKQTSRYINDGIVRLFVETLSNAVDNFFRSKNGPTPMTKLIVQYNEENNVISMMNDGNSIPIEESEVEKIPIPELIFGNLMSGSNYDDKDDRPTSGRNGLGIKLCNIFSNEFEVHCMDANSNKLYKQKWKNNMKKVNSPKIIEKNSLGFTKVIYKIDMTRFQNENKEAYSEDEKYTSQTISLFKKLLIDASMIMDGIPVYFNKTKFELKKNRMLEYVKYYDFFSKEHIQGFFGSNNEIEYCIIGNNPSNNNDELGINSQHHISFVNGIYTSENGYHVEVLTTKLYSSLQVKLKKYNISGKELKKYFSIILNANVKNPSFSSQTKDKLVSCKENLAKMVEFEDKLINKIMKWSIVHLIKENFRIKEELSMIKNTEKKRGFRSISGYDKANFSGTNKSNLCSLILCEGLSAKTYATKGISIGIDERKGRNYYGIYPMRGKCLNVRNCSTSLISNNREFKDIVQCLNLKYNIDYTIEKNFKTLHYNEIIILTDSDYDGMHIAGLLINMFQFLFPSLFDRKIPFIKYMLTPVAKMKLNGETISFFNDFEYKKKLVELEKKNFTRFNVRYLKGLGSSTDQDIKESFAEKIVGFVKDPHSDNMLDMVFDKKNSDKRKHWLLSIDEENYIVPENTYDISLFLNQDFIRFSVDDCKRSLPNLFDGLKISQRKILYSTFKKNLSFTSKAMKVAQLGSFTAEETQYHHGENCLMDCIIRLANNYVGSNNINLLEPVGQFGTRIQNSKDAASPRYIHTKLAPLTEKLFIPSDEPLYQYNFEDGSKVEPLYYLPIIPLILINGTRSIGTGWSSFIPNFKYDDVLKKIKLLLENDLEAFYSFQISPYYNNFLGEIERIEENKYITKGILEKKNTMSSGSSTNGNNKKNSYIVREIPIGESIDGYKEYLEKKLENKLIKHLKNYSTAEKIHFEFELGDNVQDSYVTLDNFKLISYLNLTNMVLITKNNTIKKFSNVDEIIQEFFSERLDLYTSRKNFIIDSMKDNILILKNKMKFILDIVVQKKINLFQNNDNQIYNYLKLNNFLEIDNSFEYLLSLPIKYITEEKYNKLQNQLKIMETEYENALKITPKQIWYQELENLSNHYYKFYK